MSKPGETRLRACGNTPHFGHPNRRSDKLPLTGASANIPVPRITAAERETPEVPTPLHQMFPKMTQRSETTAH